MTNDRRAAPSLRSILLMAALLPVGGCTLHGDREVVIAAPETPPAVARGPVPAGVKTVKRDPTADAAETTGAPDAGVPTPRQIFDFHPAGTTAETWRAPFIIDPNDGPLAGDVRRTAAELRAFLAASKAGAAPTVRRCSETDVATAKPGCIPARPIARAGAAER